MSRAVILAGLADRRREKYAYPNIAEWMNKSGMLVTELAKRTCYDVSTVSRYLTGKSYPTFIFVLSILKLSGMTFEEAFALKTTEDNT